MQVLSEKLISLYTAPVETIRNNVSDSNALSFPVNGNSILIKKEEISNIDFYIVLKNVFKICDHFNKTWPYY